VCIQKVRHAVRSVSSSLDERGAGQNRTAVYVGRKYRLGQVIGRGAFGEVRLGNSHVDSFCLMLAYDERICCIPLIVSVLCEPRTAVDAYGISK